ncbi:MULTISPECIES: hypothetical protein [Pseudomonas]|uniref:Uncharacterized protein n=2 Tax=Pseudomonas TaxID=286 RepID=A0A0D0TFG1_PSEFL|nr:MULTISPECIES: hypothetical protein [Pseudomonas fluorescens group]AZE59539.1 hypothetical protein C4K02_1161 [Pseudomonas synxantha]KIR22206.1 hypothetical protein PFLU3_24210 [Pseudomonas fluorescens]
MAFNNSQQEKGSLGAGELRCGGTDTTCSSAGYDFNYASLILRDIAPAPGHSVQS